MTAKTDQKPSFVQRNAPPAAGAYTHDMEKNHILRFFHKVMGSKPEASKTVAQINIATANSVESQTKVQELTQLEEAVIVAVGNFLAETSRGAAVHGQNISSNAEATASLDNLYDAYEQYHNLLEEVRNPSSGTTQVGANLGQSNAGTGNVSLEAKVAAPQTTKQPTPFQPKVPTPAGGTTTGEQDKSNPADSGQETGHLSAAETLKKFKQDEQKSA